jgi:L-alanine-DL-glutamate epimerase-like enolase superfamily enzyme
MRILDLAYCTDDYRYRLPLKFGGMILDRVTVATVHCTVESDDGRVGRGFGAMPLGNVWAFPSRVLGYDRTLQAMKALLGRIARLLGGYRGDGHPIDVTWALEAAYFQAAAELSLELALAEPIPPLCTLVAASPFDAALHDAFGKAYRISAYETYGPEFVRHDLAHYLGPEFEGDRLDHFLTRRPCERLPLYHLVGALDPIEAADVSRPVGDGLPVTLAEWIAADGLTHLKIKLNGDDLAWDVERVLRVERAAAAAQERRGVTDWHYSLDFNERCPHVGYLLEFLARLRQQSPAGFARIQYIEQPTARDLQAHRGNVMHEAARLCPVVIDESLVDLESLLLAREMGYTGAALKACKGQTQSLLLAAAARKYGMFLCVQDLTCPGAALIHSAGLAAHVPGVAAVEANARQYVPSANAGWAERFPGLFRITDGTLHTGALTGPGLGAGEEPIAPAPAAGS